VIAAVAPKQERPATEIKISIQRMVCTGCGAEANASCNCGVAYQPKSVRAAAAVKATPEKSDRAIAKEIGASPTTVGKARDELSTTGQLKDGPRTGLDGKTRKLPAKPDPEAEATDAEASAEARKAVYAETDGGESRALREFKYSCDTWLPKVSNEDLATATAYFDAKIFALKPKKAARP